jgi:phosphatidylglycerophosphatase A
LFSSPSHFLALGFGAGLAPVAPGTLGTLVAWPLFCVIEPRTQPLTFLAIIAAMYVFGIAICERTGRDFGVEDHKAIVWDEIVAFLLVLFFTPRGWVWQVLAFGLFRLYDALKPGPIRYIEGRFRGGFGVMIDDLAAALFTLLTLSGIIIAARLGGVQIGL